MSDSDRTTISVRRGTKKRFKKAKPFKSLSADEFINELLDIREEVSGE